MAPLTWRTGRDLNPRNLSVRRFSKPVQSAALPPVQEVRLVVGKGGGSRTPAHGVGDRRSNH
jgi:hypothetical protein